MRYAPACVDSDGSKPGGRGVRAVVLALLVVGASLAGVAGVAAAGTSSTSDDGLVAVPDANIQADLPDGADVGLSVSDLEGATETSSHADTTEVVLTTPERAGDYVGSTVGADGGELALVIQDDANHDGRRVSLPADALKAALGYLPETVHGVHDSGDEWTRPVDAGDGRLAFEVPKFSSNSVTFSGTISLSGSPATDGASYQYYVQSLDAVNDGPVVNLTGVTNTENDTISGRAESGSWNQTVEVAGTEPAPTTVTLTGGTSGAWYFPNSYMDPRSGGEESTITDPPQNITTVRYIARDASGNGVAESYDVDLRVDGSVVDSWTVTTPVDSQETQNHSVSGLNPDKNVTVYVHNIQSSDSSPIAYFKNGRVIGEDGSKNVNVTFGGTTHSVGDLARGETATVTGTLATGSQTVDFSADRSVDYGIEYTEGVKTTDASVELNGHTETYPYTLAEGETANLTLNSSWVESGTNRLNVSVGDGSLSSDAPTPAVALNYSHGAVDNVSADYTGEKWSERYNLTRHWGDATEDATLTVPFASNVVHVRDVEKRVDGGSWTTLEHSEFSLEGTTLTAQLGDLPKNSTTDLRVNGSKVQPVNGTIDVLEPTSTGSDLATRFEVTTVSGEFQLDVSETTPRKDWLHYVSNASHADPAAYASITEGGDAQTLTLPNAQIGTRATARTLPLEVRPQTDVRVAVEEAGSTPVLDVSPGSVEGDSVTYGWYDTVSESEYRLVSVTNDGTVRASGTASDGSVWLDVDTDQSETLRLEVDSDSTTSSGDGSDGDRTVPIIDDAAAAVAPSVHPVVLLGAGSAVLLGGAFVVRRTRLRIWTVYPIIGLVGLVALESLRPGAVTGTVQEIALQFGSSASTVGPALALGGGGLALWAVYRAVKKWTSQPRIVLNRK